MTTIDEIYAAINPLPAMLTAKGKVKPEVSFGVDANAGLAITMNWVKPYSPNEWDREYKHFSGKDFAEALGAATAFIKGLPSAEQAKLHNFMGKLGKLIDAGKSDGIEVDYLNPLLDTMKRLSENVITYQPAS
ncbi:hypothetical protein IVB46_11690 [Bradyrhizobium sp. 61]|uniref:hypothetical protein n=1 Tax=Bradyrhizobium sp. 61 TaxID=2782679 RepID=UPI001FF8D9CD|nr:hypothetical protein [Bradyrhizobium sp. 61]MCK1275892.1 hypothetical protein [Bradyrhizobium sp. 61]